MNREFNSIQNTSNQLVSQPRIPISLSYSTQTATCLEKFCINGRLLAVGTDGYRNIELTNKSGSAGDIFLPLLRPAMDGLRSKHAKSRSTGALVRGRGRSKLGAGGPLSATASVAAAAARPRQLKFAPQQSSSPSLSLASSSPAIVIPPVPVPSSARAPITVTSAAADVSMSGQLVPESRRSRPRSRPRILDVGVPTKRTRTTEIQKANAYGHEYAQDGGGNIALLPTGVPLALRSSSSQTHEHENEHVPAPKRTRGRSNLTFSTSAPSLLHPPLPPSSSFSFAGGEAISKPPSKLPQTRITTTQPIEAKKKKTSDSILDASLSAPITQTTMKIRSKKRPREAVLEEEEDGEEEGDFVSSFEMIQPTTRTTEKQVLVTGGGVGRVRRTKRFGGEIGAEEDETLDEESLGRRTGRRRGGESISQVNVVESFQGVEGAAGETTNGRETRRSSRFSTISRDDRGDELKGMEGGKICGQEMRGEREIRNDHDCFGDKGGGGAGRRDHKDPVGRDEAVKERPDERQIRGRKPKQDHGVTLGNVARVLPPRSQPASRTLQNQIDNAEPEPDDISSLSTSAEGSMSLGVPRRSLRAPRRSSRTRVPSSAALLASLIEVTDVEHEREDYSGRVEENVAADGTPPRTAADNTEKGVLEDATPSVKIAKENGNNRFQQSNTDVESELKERRSSQHWRSGLAGEGEDKEREIKWSLYVAHVDSESASQSQSQSQTLSQQQSQSWTRLGRPPTQTQSFVHDKLHSQISETSSRSHHPRYTTFLYPAGERRGLQAEQEPSNIAGSLGADQEPSNTAGSLGADGESPGPLAQQTSPVPPRIVPTIKNREQSSLSFDRARQSTQLPSAGHQNALPHLPSPSHRPQRTHLFVLSPSPRVGSAQYAEKMQEIDLENEQEKWMYEVNDQAEVLVEQEARLMRIARTQKGRGSILEGEDDGGNWRTIKDCAPIRLAPTLLSNEYRFIAPPIRTSLIALPSLPPFTIARVRSLLPDWFKVPVDVPPQLGGDPDQSLGRQGLSTLQILDPEMDLLQDFESLWNMEPESSSIREDTNNHVTTIITSSHITLPSPSTTNQVQKDPRIQPLAFHISQVPRPNLLPSPYTPAFKQKLQKTSRTSDLARAAAANAAKRVGARGELATERAEGYRPMKAMLSPFTLGNQTQTVESGAMFESGLAAEAASEGFHPVSENGLNEGEMSEDGRDERITLSTSVVEHQSLLGPDALQILPPRDPAAGLHFDILDPPHIVHGIILPSDDLARHFANAYAEPFPPRRLPRTKQSKNRKTTRFDQRHPHMRVKWIIPIHGDVTSSSSFIGTNTAASARLLMDSSKVADSVARETTKLTWTTNQLEHLWFLLRKMAHLGRFGMITLCVCGPDPHPFRRDRDRGQEDGSEKNRKVCVGDHIKLFCDLEWAMRIRFVLASISFPPATEPPPPSFHLHPPKGPVEEVKSGGTQAKTIRLLKKVALCLLGEENEVLCVA